MNIPNTMIRNVNSRRGGVRSSAEAFVEGDAVVASAMVSPEQLPGFLPEPLQNYFA